MRVLSYNIRYGGRRRERALAKVIASVDPDVAVLQEATDPRVVASVAALTGLHAFSSRHGESLAFLARRPPVAVDWRFLAGARHACLVLQPADTAWRILGVHLRAMHVNWAERRRVLDARAVVAAARTFDGAPHVIAGDFNSLPPGDVLDLRRLPLRIRALVRISGRRITWRVVQTLIDAGYADGWVAAGRLDPGDTFPSKRPHLRLDYAFVPAALGDLVRGCRPLGEAPEARVASDHLALFTDLAEPG